MKKIVLTKESEIKPGKFYETPNGNIYFKVTNFKSVYIRNRDHSRSQTNHYMEITDVSDAQCVHVTPKGASHD